MRGIFGVPSDGELGFATRLYRQIAANPSNTFFSPMSIRLCLGLAYAGARAQTATEMRAALGFADANTEYARVAGQLERWDALAKPELPEGVDATASELSRRTTQLYIANRLFAQNGHAMRADYLAVLKRAYRAEPASMNFAENPETARAEINRWVSDRTQKKIPELVQPKMVTKDTRSVLVNAIYFKASWRTPFETRDTKVEPFFVAKDQSVKTPLMHQTDYFSIANVDGAQLLEMPYSDGKLSMVVVLPSQEDGLASIEKQIAGDALSKWLPRLKGERVEVTLPKFKVRSRFDLGEALKRLGMPTAFEFPGADFSGIDDTKLLFLSAVIHEAVVDVDENGTEAAAATAAVMLAGGMPTEPKKFRADHPFVFFIRDQETGAMLFMGRVIDPSK